MATANLTQQRQRLSPARILITLVLAGLLVGMGFVLGVVFMRVLGNGSQPSVGSLAPERPTPIPGTEPTIDREKLLDQITRLLESEYLEPDELVADDLTYGAAAGLVSAVGDPHTMFVEPVQAAIIEEDMQGSFEGIGATVNLVDGIVTIVQPMPNSPAERAGIQAGDQVLAVDDTSLEGYALLDAITLIRGPKGTVVSLLLRRAGIAEPFTVQVTRDKITVAIVESRMLDDGIAYISLSEFNGKALEQIREAWRTLSKQNPTGLVLDLRNNPGGYLHMAIGIASEFLPQGTLIVTERQRSGDPEEFHVNRSGSMVDVPLVVLVNGGSASASEILAGAIQYHGRGKLVGVTTFGKGSVQSTHTLTDGSSLRVTIAKWILPGGRILDGDGLEPDVPVEISPEQAAAGEDPQLDRAIEVLLESTR